MKTCGEPITGWQVFLCLISKCITRPKWAFILQSCTKGFLGNDTGLHLPRVANQCTLTLREFIITLKPMEIRMPPGKQNWITFHQTKQIQSSAMYILKLNSWLPGKIL